MSISKFVPIQSGANPNNPAVSSIPGTETRSIPFHSNPKPVSLHSQQTLRPNPGIINTCKNREKGDRKIAQYKPTNSQRTKQNRNNNQPTNASRHTKPSEPYTTSSSLWPNRTAHTRTRLTTTPFQRDQNRSNRTESKQNVKEVVFSFV